MEKAKIHIHVFLNCWWTPLNFEPMPDAFIDKVIQLSPKNHFQPNFQALFASCEIFALLSSLKLTKILIPNGWKVLTKNGTIKKKS